MLGPHAAIPSPVNRLHLGRNTRPILAQNSRANALGMNFLRRDGERASVPTHAAAEFIRGEILHHASFTGHTLVCTWSEEGDLAT